jgi:hypothetical protein
MTTEATRRPFATNLPGTTGDRLDITEVLDYFSRPRPYQQVEDAEAELLRVWRDVLGGETEDPAALEACALFFSQLGFLFKYKVYGVKVALPFGYSLFDLVDGEGFSFQVHEEPKLEGFHILAPKRDALLYVADRHEWEADGRAWAQCSAEERRGSGMPAGALTPRAGDVAAVQHTGVVHTVLGCVLEEYASCSVDSVVRLHDQNTRGEVELPQRHPSVSRMLGRGSRGLPLRRLARSGTGWVERISAQPGEVIDSDHVRGWRTELAAGETMGIPEGSSVTSLVVVRGRVRATVGSRAIRRSPGEVVVVPPGLAVTVATGDGCVLSLHQVPASLATYDWSR